MRLFWTVQASIAVAGIAGLLAFATPACSNVKGAATNGGGGHTGAGACTAYDTSTSTETEAATDIGTHTVECSSDTMTETESAPCVPNEAAMGYLEGLPPQASAVAAFKFSAVGTTDCAAPSVNASTIADPARAQAVFIALAMNASANMACTEVPPPPCQVLEYKIQFLANDASVVAEADLQFGDFVAQTVGGFAVTVGDGFYAALAQGLGVPETDIYPWCTTAGCSL